MRKQAFFWYERVCVIFAQRKGTTRTAQPAVAAAAPIAILWATS